MKVPGSNPTCDFFSPWETSLWLKGPGSKNKHFCLKIEMGIIIKLGSSDLRHGDRRTSE